MYFPSAASNLCNIKFLFHIFIFFFISSHRNRQVLSLAFLALLDLHGPDLPEYLADLVVGVLSTTHLFCYDFLLEVVW